MLRPGDIEDLLGRRHGNPGPCRARARPRAAGLRRGLGSRRGRSCGAAARGAGGSARRRRMPAGLAPTRSPSWPVPFLATRAGGAVRAGPAMRLPRAIWSLGICPFCGGPARTSRTSWRRPSAPWPVTAGGGAWLFAKLRCPFCGVDGAAPLARLPRTRPREEGYLVSACRECRAYMKEVDRRARWNAGPALVEELGLAPLRSHRASPGVLAADSLDRPARGAVIAYHLIGNVVKSRRH